MCWGQSVQLKHLKAVLQHTVKITEQVKDNKYDSLPY